MAPDRTGKSVFLGNIPYSVYPSIVSLTGPTGAILTIRRSHGGASQRHSQHGWHRHQIPPDDEPRDRQAQGIWIR